MKIGISTACLYNLANTEEAFNLIKQTGADCCEIYLQTFYEYRPEFAKKYAERAAGLEVNSIHVAPHNFEPQLFFNDRRTRGDGFYWLDQILRSAQLWGANNYTFHGGIRNDDVTDYDTLSERLREIADFCLSYGVTLCLENVRGLTYNRPGVFRELKARCQQIAGVFNNKQASKSCYPYQMYIEDMRGCISHAHISDVDGNGNTCLPGEGVYDFAEIFARLHDTGFDGSVLIDVQNGDLNALKNSVEFLKETADKIK